jgi:hypothetical protein
MWEDFWGATRTVELTETITAQIHRRRAPATWQRVNAGVLASRLREMPHDRM